VRTTLLCWLWLVICPVGWASTHYLDSAKGNDANDGISPATAWKTIAKVNSSKFQPGDVILFRRAEMWREQLNLSSSGSLEAPITIDAYGEGPPPIISGADLVPPESWSICDNCPAHIWRTTVVSQTNVVIFDGVKGSRKSAQSELKNPGEWFWQSATLYVYSNDSPATAYSHPGIEFGLRPSGIFLTGLSYIVVKNIEVSGANAAPYTEGAGIWAATVHLAGPTPDTLVISRVVVINGGGDGIHLENSDRSTVDSSMVANNEGAGVELYHSNGKFPITSAKITNNEIHHNHFNGIFVVGCPRAERCRSVVYPEGLVVTGVTIEGNQVHENGAGIYLHETNDSVISGNTAYSNTDASRKGEGYCVGLSGSSSNIVEKNNCYQARLSGIELSIDTGSPPFGSSNNVIRYNIIHDDGTHGVFTNYVPSQNNKILYNLIYNHPNGSCIMANYMGHEIYNNTCYNSFLGIHLYVSKTTPKTGNISVKNNIIAKNSKYAVLVEPGVDGPVYFANNNYFPGGPNIFNWRGALFDFAGWRENTGQDINSIAADPRFSSASPNSPQEFSLRSDSRDIGSGADLGPDYEKALAPEGSWPKGVRLSLQQKKRWDIGAFRHP